MLDFSTLSEESTRPVVVDNLQRYSKCFLEMWLDYFPPVG